MQRLQTAHVVVKLVRVIAGEMGLFWGGAGQALRRIGLRVAQMARPLQEWLSER